ncbi:two-component system response regulator [Shewanella sp. OPT22]|nr:two-component system response regulator [Shewanella sp. OPT22]
MAHVLVVEDAKDLAATIIDYMEFEGHQCDYASNGLQACELIEANRYQVIILDINLPKMDGFSVCQRIRDNGIDTPVLMLTARDTLDDKVFGFQSGTDDYLVKPFELEELHVRVLSLAKRRSGQINKLTLDELSLDLSNKQCLFGEHKIKLTPVTYKLLEALVRASPEPVSHQDLVKAIWGDELKDPNSLRVHVFNLRKAFDPYLQSGLIHTVPGFGFAAFTENKR